MQAKKSSAAYVNNLDTVADQSARRQSIEQVSQKEAAAATAAAITPNAASVIVAGGRVEQCYLAQQEAANADREGSGGDSNSSFNAASVIVAAGPCRQCY